MNSFCTTDSPTTPYLAMKVIPSVPEGVKERSRWPRGMTTYSLCKTPRAHSMVRDCT